MVLLSGPQMLALSVIFSLSLYDCCYQVGGKMPTNKLRHVKRKPNSNICNQPSWPPGDKNFFSCSTQLSLKFILLINVKMQTIVGILHLTLRSMINTTF